MLDARIVPIVCLGWAFIIIQLRKALSLQRFQRMNNFCKVGEIKTTM